MFIHLYDGMHPLMLFKPTNDDQKAYGLVTHLCDYCHT